jgi:hypothetical protein
MAQQISLGPRHSFTCLETPNKLKGQFHYNLRKRPFSCLSVKTKRLLDKTTSGAILVQSILPNS